MINGKNKPSLAEQLQNLIRKKASKHIEFSNLSLLVFSEKLGINFNLQANGNSVEAFHIASAGKLFTTALIGLAVDRGLLTLDTKIGSLLEPNLLKGLFERNGVDYQGNVTVSHLLTHTSGLADYFSDPGFSGKTLFQTMVEHPQRHWTPQDLLEYQRKELTYPSEPGRLYHYSDTGFILLGLIIEACFHSSLDQTLAREILKPLGMHRTWMPFVGIPEEGSATMRPAYILGTDVSSFPSITMDWAGGGIAGTAEDLLVFSRALWEGRLVSKSTLDGLQKFDYPFIKGIDYGLGLMRYDFGKFFFLLSGYPRMVGHMGILGTQVFYDPGQDLHIILSYGSDRASEQSVRLLIEVLGRIRS